ncbi:MAG: hypothetical protein D3910_04070 [Candidatus Electrothrix sp. ATG2]|nr:hypothetical protein [Candidatus Electrothrix sp. ATG2]
MTKLAEQEKLPFLFVDSGSLLFQRKTISAKKELAEKIKANAIIASMQAMNCRAIGIGAHDLSSGIDFLKELQERHKTVWLSMNLVDPEKKQPIFTPYLITEVGDLKIALLGLTDDQGTHNEEGKKKEYTVLPWQDTLSKMVSKVGKKVDMTILLSSYSYQTNKEIAESVDGLHLILESGHAAPTTAPYQVQDTLIAQTGTRGKYLGMMRIDWNAAGQWTDKPFHRIQLEENRLKQVERQLARMEKQKKKADLTKDKGYKSLKKEKKQIVNNLKLLKKRRKSTPKNDGMSQYSNRFIPLNTSLPEDPDIKKIVDLAIQEANEVNKKRIQKTGLNESTITLQDLAGSQKCQQCHAPQMTVWQDSKHAQAWTTLEKKNQQFNDDCVLCHVTLPSYDADKVKASNLLLMLPKPLKNVGCEACHGPAAAHSAGQGKVPVPRPDEKVCLGCHTPEHDDHFVFSEKVMRLGCSPIKEEVKPKAAQQEEKGVEKEKVEEKQTEEKGKKDRQESSQPTASEPESPEPAEPPTITPHGKKVKK